MKDANDPGGSSAPLFGLFWENSKLNERNMASFVDGFANERPGAEKIKYPAIGLRLELPKDRLFKAMRKRQSGRAFGGHPVSERQLSSLFSCFADVEGRRLLPSGGGKYPIEVYALLFHVEGGSKLGGKAVYYNWDSNSLSVVGDCPDWKEIEGKTGLLVEGEPSILFVFVAFPDRMASKYGERGGRFVLIESGHYLQNLSLRAGHENLRGVEAGGLHDDYIKGVLGLGGTGAIITLGYACGK